jgi:phosphoribosylformylglycinamidine synthase
LVVIQKGKEAEVKAIFDKWDLHCAQIGVVVKEQRLHFYHGVPKELEHVFETHFADPVNSNLSTVNQYLVANVPAHDLVLGGGAPVYHREYREPAYFKEFQKFDINQIAQPSDYTHVAKALLALPNIASKRWIYQQYDSMIGTSTLTTNAPSDAAVVNVKGTQKAIAITVDCNSRYVNANPEEGCAIAVAESARNVVCSGGYEKSLRKIQHTRNGRECKFLQSIFRPRTCASYPYHRHVGLASEYARPHDTRFQSTRRPYLPSGYFQKLYF